MCKCVVDGGRGDGVGTVGATVGAVQTAVVARGGDVLARTSGRPFGAGGWMLSRPPTEVAAALVPIVSLCPSETWAEALACAAESGTGERHGPVQMLQGERAYRLAVGVAYPSPRRKCGYECRRVEIVEEVEYDSIGTASALSQAARSLPK